jgi:hypothetical protein
MNLVQRTSYQAPRVPTVRQRAVIKDAGFTMFERGPYWTHVRYPGFFFSVAAAYQLTSNGMPAFDGRYVLPRDTR